MERTKVIINKVINKVTVTLIHQFINFPILINGNKKKGIRVTVTFILLPYFRLYFHMTIASLADIIEPR